MRIRKTSQYIEGGAGLPSYFTDEIDTGMKWIDGKPIYRKVFNIGTLSSSPTFIETGLTDNEISRFINYYAIGNRNEGSDIIIPYVNDDITYQIQMRILPQGSANSRRIVFIFSPNTLGNVTNVFAILEYTKTTD